MRCPAHGELDYVLIDVSDGHERVILAPAVQPPGMKRVIFKVMKDGSVSPDHSGTLNGLDSEIWHRRAEEYVSKTVEGRCSVRSCCHGVRYSD
jgi:hypothetical protein